MILTSHIYKFSLFPSHVMQGISTKYFGSMKTNGVFNNDIITSFASALKVQTIIVPQQQHTATFKEITSHIQPSLAGVDGLFTKERQIGLGIVTADCLPIIFYDPQKKIVGIVHAGFKGILAGIIQQMVTAFASKSCLAKNILIGIGPGIGVCCYDVPLERIQLFKETFPYLNNFYETRNNKYFLNLSSIAQQILVKNGINAEHIELANICTSTHNDMFYSRRAEGEGHGQFITVIGLS